MTDTLSDYVPGAHSAYLSWTDVAGNAYRLLFDCVVDEKWDDDAELSEHPVEQGANVGDHVRVALVKCTLTIKSTNEPIDSSSGTDPDDAVQAQQVFQLGVPPPAPVPNLIVVPTWENPIALRALADTLVGLAAGPAGAVVGAAAIDALVPGFVLPVPTPIATGLTPQVPGAPVMPTVQTFPGGTDYVEALLAQLRLLKDNAQVIDVYGSKRVQFSMAITAIGETRNSETGTGSDVVLGLKEIRQVSTQTVVAPIPDLSGGGGTPTTNLGAQDPSAASAQAQSVALAGAQALIPASLLPSFLQ